MLSTSIYELFLQRPCHKNKSSSLSLDTCFIGQQKNCNRSKEIQIYAMTCYIGIVFIDPLLKTVAIVQCIYHQNISFLIYKKDIRLWLIHYLFILFFSFCCLFLANVNHTKNIIETKLNITNRRKRVFISGKIKNSETCFCKLLKDIFPKHKWAFQFPAWLSQTWVSCVFV